MTPALHKLAAFVGTLLLVLIIGLSNPIAAYVFLTCFVSSYIVGTITGVDESPKSIVTETFKYLHNQLSLYALR